MVDEKVIADSKDISQNIADGILEQQQVFDSFVYALIDAGKKVQKSDATSPIV